MVWVEDLYAFSTYPPWCLSERKSRVDTGKGLLTLQGFVFTNREDQLGPVPTLEASLWTTWKLRLQKSLVGKYHTVIHPRISHCLLYAFIFVERAWNSRASEL